MSFELIKSGFLDDSAHLYTLAHYYCSCYCYRCLISYLSQVLLPLRKSYVEKKRAHKFLLLVLFFVSASRRKILSYTFSRVGSNQKRRLQYNNIENNSGSLIVSVFS